LFKVPDTLLCDAEKNSNHIPGEERVLLPVFLSGTNPLSDKFKYIDLKTHKRDILYFTAGLIA
jgi:hypothetical protein